jgi:hypothetical protein
MSRRSIFVAIGLFLLLLCGVGGVLWLLARYEPAAYLHAAIPPGEARKQLARQFTIESTRMYSAMGGKSDDPSWEGKFTQDQVNAYLAETFVISGLEKQLPEYIQQPRVIFEPDRLRLAFRYGRGLWSTVVSLDLRVWVTKDEPNSVALQVIGFHAGALPISAQSLLEPMMEVGRQNGIDVVWYRHEGCPVALLRFQADMPRPTLALQAVIVEQGLLALRGHFNDGTDAPSPLRPQPAPTAADGD